MKKSPLILVLLFVMLFSFVSCEKDKTEEVIDNFIQFNNIVDFVDRMDSDFNDSSFFKDVTSEGIEATYIYSSPAVLRTVLNLDKEHHHLMYSSGSNKIKGTISGQYTDDDNYSVTFSNVVLTVSYQEKDESGKDVGELKENQSFTFNGSFSKSYKNDITSWKCSMTVNDKSYNYTYTKDKNDAYTEASINGTEIDIRLLNAEM